VPRARQAARPPGASGPRPARDPGHHPRPRPDPGHRARADADGKITAACGSSCSPTWAPTCSWSPRASRCSARSCTTRSTRWTRCRSPARRVHQQDPDRRLPRRRPARGHLRHRAADGRGSPPSSAWTRSSCGAQLDPHEEFPYETIAGLTYDSGNYEAATAGQGAVRLRRRARRAGRRRERRPGPARHRHLTSPRCAASPRPGARLAQLRRRRLGARQRPDAAHRQGAGRHRHLAARAGPRDLVVEIAADKLGIPRRRRGAPRRHRMSPTRHGHLRVAVAGRSAARRRMACDKVVDKAKQIAAHLLEARGRPRVRRRHVPGAGLAPTRDHHPGHRARGVHRPRLPRGMEPNLDSRGDRRPGELLLPPRHPPVRVEVDTETGARRPATTSPSTTSATRSTRRSSRARSTAGSSRASPRRCTRRRSTTPTATSHRLPHRLPTCPSAADLPFVTDGTETPATTNPLGVKGVGEAGTIASAPAVINAVVDALRPSASTTSRCRQSPATCGRPSRPPRRGSSNGGAA
jgi:aerobic carbon-monoxide dehydrogenase large subunit